MIQTSGWVGILWVFLSRILEKWEFSLKAQQQKNRFDSVSKHSSDKVQFKIFRTQLYDTYQLII